jgi:hypothetical protein
MSLPGARVKATRGGYLSSFLFFTPPPVFADPEDCAVSVKDGKLLLVAADREWAFELFLDTVFEEVVESVDGKPSPSLYTPIASSRNQAAATTPPSCTSAATPSAPPGRRRWRRRAMRRSVREPFHGPRTMERASAASSRAQTTLQSSTQLMLLKTHTMTRLGSAAPVPPTAGLQRLRYRLVSYGPQRRRRGPADVPAA